MNRDDEPGPSSPASQNSFDMAFEDVGPVVVNITADEVMLAYEKFAKEYRQQTIKSLASVYKDRVDPALGADSVKA